MSTTVLRALAASERRARRQLGIGLVELMVAVTIGMVLIAGALGVFVNSRKTYTVNQEVARLLENGNYALDEITRSLALAGYWGRNNTSVLVRGRTGDSQFTPIASANPATNDCTAGWYANVGRRVEGLDNTNAAYSTTCVLNARYQAGTDVLVVRHVEPVPVATLQANTVYVRSDPAGAELFVGTTVPGGFTTIAENFLLRSMAFYVSPFSLTVGDGIPALKVAALATGPTINVPGTPSADEIVIPGVENMQVQYGLDTNGDASANSYVDADKVTANQWGNVTAVRIWLLVRAEVNEFGYSNTSTYRLPDGLFTAPGDGFRRLLVTRTVQLRNL